LSQPCHRGAEIPRPGKLDASLGEFWVENPWDIIKEGFNLSCYERKRTFLNVAGTNQGRDFVDISHLTGADNDSDGRSVVAGDLRNCGQLDLIVRQVGGGPVIIYENNFIKKHYLGVSLRGKQRTSGLSSNSLGIGSRLIATVNGRKLVREVYPLNSYRSQMPTAVHFGLADASSVEKLEIQWPSGFKQELRNLSGDRHIIVDEEGAATELIPGQINTR
jgi:hypothetical protein